MDDNFQKAYNIADIILSGNNAVSDLDIVNAVNKSLLLYPGFLE